MPDMGHDIKDFQVFTWRLSSWKKLDKKLTSPEFECGGHKWSVSPTHHLRPPHSYLVKANIAVPFWKFQLTT